MAGKVYGYARVSSREQNLGRQLDAFDAFGVPSENVFADKASGKRPLHQLFRHYYPCCHVRENPTESRFWVVARPRFRASGYHPRKRPSEGVFPEFGE